MCCAPSFWTREVGFPFAFASTMLFGPWSTTHFQLVPVVLDFLFWLAVTYVFFSGVPFRSAVVRVVCEVSVGVVTAFFLALMSWELLYQDVSQSNLIDVALFATFALVLGYVESRRGLAPMGLAVSGVAIFLVVVALG